MVKGISPGSQVSDAVRQLAFRRLEPAVEALRSTAEADRDDVVYDVRKRCKRVRALLRLVRYDLGSDVYRCENRALRDAARALSPVRDAKVLIGVHDEVAESAGTTPPGLRESLVARHEALRREIFESDTAERVGDTLAEVLARIDTWPLGDGGWDVLGAGVERVYRRARKAMAAAEDPTTERFHEWRRRAKYHRHQLDFLNELWPEVIGASTRTARDLTDVLGDEHDLAVLGEAVAERVAPDAGDAGPFADLIACRRAVLQARARPLGLRVFAEKPSRFVDRLGRYWEAGALPGAAA